MPFSLPGGVVAGSIPTTINILRLGNCTLPGRGLQSVESILFKIKISSASSNSARCSVLHSQLSQRSSRS